MEIQNNWGDEAIEVAIDQFHGENFTATPPMVFSEQLLVRQLRVRLAPHERRLVTFNDASGSEHAP